MRPLSHLFVLALVVGSPSVLQAQTSPRTDKASAVCFDADVRARCRRFALFEIEAATDQRNFDASWNLGLMQNVDDHRALGGSVEVGSSNFGERYAVKVRARKWLANGLAVDGEAGPLTIRDAPSAAYGLTAGTALAYRELFAVTAHMDLISRRDGQGLLRVGARAGSWPAVVITAAVIGLGIAVARSFND